MKKIYYWSAIVVLCFIGVFTQVDVIDCFAQEYKWSVDNIGSDNVERYNKVWSAISSKGCKWYWISYNNYDDPFVFGRGLTNESWVRICYSVQHGGFYYIDKNSSIGFIDLYSIKPYCNYWRTNDDPNITTGSPMFGMDILIDTNIPIFETNDYCTEFLETNDITHAMNASSVKKEPTYDSEVETPSGVKGMYNNSIDDYDGPAFAEYIVWDSPNDSTLKAEIYYKTQGEYLLMNVFGKLSNNTPHTFESFKLAELPSSTCKFDWWSSDISMTQYSTIKRLDYQKNLLDETKQNDNMAYQSVLKKDNLATHIRWRDLYIYYYIRYISTDNRSSDWVMVKFDVQNSSSTEKTMGNQSLGGDYGVQDGDRTTLSGDKDINELTDDDIKSVEHIDGVKDGDFRISDTGTILDWVKSGFGLIGDNGLLSFISSVFDFLPAPIWTVVIGFFGVGFLVGIYKLIRG